MTTSPHIILNNVSFSLKTSSARFDKINITFKPLKYGIVGRNGAGKTTFLKLLAGDYQPDSGSIERHGDIIEVAQAHHHVRKDASISDALGVSHILRALERIKQGSLDEVDFDRACEHWDLENKITAALYKFNLQHIPLDTLFHELSGGQKTKILLTKTFIFPSSFILFDEPTNNLDLHSRETLYQFFNDSERAMITVSHDRALLNRCDLILKLSRHRFTQYGGNYNFYETEKAQQALALEKEIQARTEILQKSKQTIQTRMQRHQKNQAHGRKEKINQIKSKGRYNKIELNAKKGRSEQTNRRIRQQAQRKLDSANAELAAARAQHEEIKQPNMMLKDPGLSNKKMLLSIEQLNFHYANQNRLIDNFNCHIAGSDRIAITGPNGCGKSTLIQLIRGLLKPLSGDINVGVKQIAYLDQTVSMLKHDTSILENFLTNNPSTNTFDAYSALAAFNFRNREAEKFVYQLSNGEKMRAGLAISLMAKEAPQLIILDEPTNHLDLDSVRALETALQAYQGAILAVSHDRTFLNNIRIGTYISL